MLNKCEWLNVWKFCNPVCLCTILPPSLSHFSPICMHLCARAETHTHTHIHIHTHRVKNLSSSLSLSLSLSTIWTLIDRLIDWPIDRSINRSDDQSICWSIYRSTDWFLHWQRDSQRGRLVSMHDELSKLRLTRGILSQPRDNLEHHTCICLVTQSRNSPHLPENALGTSYLYHLHSPTIWTLCSKPHSSRLRLRFPSGL